MRSSFEKIRVIYIALGHLSPHPRVQRRLKAARVQQLVAAFDPVVFGCLKVVVGRMVGGVQHYLIVDGQHRYFAALEWLDGDDTQVVPCRVIEAKSDAEAAVAFIKENEQLALKPIDLFLQRVIARDPVAVGVASTAERAGVKVGYGGTNVVSACARCEALYRKAGGPEALRRALTILHDAWGGRLNAFHGGLIGGLGELVLEHGDAMADAELSAKLKRKGMPDDFVGEARSRARMLRTDLARAAKHLMIAEYNTGRRTHKLPIAA